MKNSEVIDNLIKSRRAIRSFLDTPVPQELIREILEVARFAPSNSNTQPWRVYVVTGDRRQTLSEAILSAHETQPDSHSAHFKHFPEPLYGDYLTRQNEFAAAYYGTLGIERMDMRARRAQTGRNFLFFGAPIGLIFTIERGLEQGSWLDYGIFLQTVMIAAYSRGLGTCPQISFAKYHKVIREHLPIDEQEIVVCGISMGYADQSSAVNHLQTSREPVEMFASFLGFEGSLSCTDQSVGEAINE